MKNSIFKIYATKDWPEGKYVTIHFTMSPVTLQGPSTSERKIIISLLKDAIKNLEDLLPLKSIPSSDEL